MITHVDRNCFRGPRPPDLKELRIDFGIDTIIDLESGVYDLINGILPQFPPDFGISYYHMPCSDIMPPPAAYVAKALDLMSDVDRHVYVHCLAGVDRTGFVCAAYRMRIQKWSFEDARKEWINLGRHPYYFYWERNLRQYAAK